MYIEEYDLLRLARVNNFQYPIESFDHPEQITQMMCDVYHLDKKAEEYLYSLGLTANGRLAGIFMIAKGGPNCAYVNPTSIFRTLLLLNAIQFVMVHNHPSANIKPSKSDIEITKRIAKSAELIGLQFTDHIIIGEDDFYSFAAECPELLGGDYKNG